MKPKGPKVYAPSEMTNQSIRKILVFAPNWLGDAAMCTAAFRVLSKHFADAEMILVARESVCALLESAPWFAGTVTLPKRLSPGATFGVGLQLRRYSAELAVVFPHSSRAALLARLSGTRERLGYARQWRSLLLTRRVKPYVETGRITPVYMAKEYLDLVAAIGCQDDDAGLELFTDPCEAESLRLQFEALGKGGPLVGVAPGAAFGPSKMWPPDRYVAAINGLGRKTDARFVLLTGPGEEDVRARILDGVEAPIFAPAADRGGISVLKAAISQLDLLLCNDSGPRHIAVAFKVPTVCLMGPTSPRYTDSPYEIGRLLRIDVDCGPCQKPVCETDHRCMTGIGPETVIESALEILAGRGGGV